MPCYDSRVDEDRERNAKLVVEYSEKIDRLTDMLCDVCSTIQFENLPQNVRGWYSRHLDDDRSRVSKLFSEKYDEYQSKLQDMSGEELRRLEEMLDKI